MAEQIDKIIIMFELHGAAQAQAILTSMNTVLAQLGKTSGTTGKAVTQIGAASGFAAKNIQVFGNMTSDTILKVSEFAVVIFAVVGAYRALLGPLVDIEHNMAIVKAVSHATTEELKALEKEAIRLGTIFPGGAQKATEALVAIGQAGYDTRQALELMEPVFRLATIGEVEFERAIRLIIPTLNAFNFTTADSAKVVDILASSISHTLTEVETFEIALPKLSNLANELNVSFEDLVALVGYLTDIGLPASKTYTALTNTFNQLEKNSLKLKKVLQGTGLSAEKLDIQSQGLRNVLQTVAEANLSAAEKMELLGIRGFVAGSILEKDFNKALDEMVEALNISGEALFEAGAMTSSLRSKFGQLGGTLQETLSNVFGPAIDVLKNIVDQIKFFIKVLGNISPAAKEWTRWITGIVLGLLAFSIWLKATKLLIVDFIWKRGILAAGVALSGFSFRIMVAGEALAALRLGFITTGQAAGYFWSAVLGPVGAAAAIIGVIAFIRHETNEFKKSIEGKIYMTERDIQSTRTQIQELDSLKARLTKSAVEYGELKKAGKDSRVALAEFYGVLLDIIDKYPQMSATVLNLASDFGNLEFAVRDVNVVVDTLGAKLESLMDYMEELRRIEFMGELLKLAPTLETALRVPSGKIFKRPAQWLQDFLEEVAPLPYAPGGLRQIAPGGTWFQVPGYQPAYDTMEKALDAIAEMSAKQLADFADLLLRYPPSGVSTEEWSQRVIKFNQKIVEKQIAEALAALEVPAEEITDRGPGAAGRYRVPGVSEFAAQIARQRIEDSLARQLTQYRQIAFTRKSQLDIEEDLLRFQKTDIDVLINLHNVRIAELEAHKATLTSAEDIAKVDEEIFKLQTNILKLHENIVAIDIKIHKNLQKQLEDFWKPVVEKVIAFNEEWQRAFSTVQSFGDILDEIAQEQYLDRLFGADTLENVKNSLSLIESKVRELVKLRDQLTEDLEDKGFFSRNLWNWIINAIDNVIDRLLALRDEFAEMTEEAKLKENLEDIREEFKEGIQSALVNAFMSEDVKDAAKSFLNFFRRLAAEYLAKYLMERMALTFGTAEAGPGGAAGTAAGLTAMGAGGAAGMGAMPWIAAGMILIPMLSNLFDRGFDKLAMKLEYILRGGGYQLPPSFVLPEDEGEFAFRRRGRDSLMIRFPKRQIEILIRNQIEIDPAELMRVTASQITVGGMGGARQFSLLMG